MATCGGPRWTRRQGRRPVVLVSRDDAYQRRQLVLVSPVTTRVRGIPSEVRLGPPDGLPRECAANADTIVTIDKGRVVEFVARLSPTKLRKLNDALRYALGLR